MPTAIGFNILRQGKMLKIYAIKNKSRDRLPVKEECLRLCVCIILFVRKKDLRASLNKNAELTNAYTLTNPNKADFFGL